MNSTTLLLYIGVDDTDMLDDSGTGQLARALAWHLQEKYGLELDGVSRHQLLQDPRIPCTRKNRCSCLLMRGTGPSPGRVIEDAREFVIERAVEGSDPGLCVAASGEVPSGVIRFGYRAKQEVLDQEMALETASKAGVFLEPLGGTGGGIIGALAAVGLRASGGDGWLTLWRGIRDVDGTVTVARLLREGLDGVEAEEGAPLGLVERVDTQGMVRPLLRQGRVVLVVRRGEAGLWQPVKR